MERKLKTRKRRKKYSGRAVRVSNAVIDALLRKHQGARSFDAILRKLLGMPDWKGNPCDMVEGVLDTMTGRFFLRTASWEAAETDAYESAIKDAARQGTKKVSKPLRLRQIP